MPTYEYRCEKCRKKFSVVAAMAEHGKKKVSCPKCKSRKVVQLLSGFTARTSRKS
jgi:putative FmdB family regulatory protein